jgi:hypothetical protein
MFRRGAASWQGCDRWKGSDLARAQPDLGLQFAPKTQAGFFVPVARCKAQRNVSTG